MDCQTSAVEWESSVYTARGYLLVEQLVASATCMQPCNEIFIHIEPVKPSEHGTALIPSPTSPPAYKAELFSALRETT